jgi:hypothetical protein
MVMTFSGFSAASFRANAQEPPRDVGVPADPPRPAPEAKDAPPPAAETKAPPPASSPANTAVTGAAEKAETTAAPSAPPEPAVAGAEEGAKEKKKKGKKNGAANGKEESMHAEARGRFGTFELKGRIYARGEFDRSNVTVLNDQLVPVQQTVDSFDLSVPTARIGLHYQAPMEWLTAVLELDISGKPDMKDGYVQAKDEHFTVRAGQFKMPVSAIESTSPWALPMVRFGLLHDVLIDRLDYGGRRPGVIVGYRDRTSPLHPRLTLGAFQGSYLSEDITAAERETDLLNGMKGRNQSLVARGEVELAGVEVGAYFEDRVGSPALFQTAHYWTAGGDAVYDHVFGNGGLRLWGEVISGASWYELQSKPVDNKDAVFVSARAIAAYRFGGTSDEAFYVEPYVLGAALDPDTTITDDMLFEGVVGINVGYWKRARLSLQGEINKGQRNFPEGYYAGKPPDRIGVILQAGVAF